MKHGAVGYGRDIRPLFRERDVSSMRGTAFLAGLAVASNSAVLMDARVKPAHDDSI